MSEVVFKKDIALATGRRHKVWVPAALIVKSVEEHKEVVFGHNESISVLEFNREMLKMEDPEIFWDIEWGTECTTIQTGKDFEIRSNLRGNIYFGPVSKTSPFDLLKLDSNEFKIEQVSRLTVSVFPYTKKRSREVNCNVVFAAPILKTSGERKRSVLKNEIGEFKIDESEVDSSETLVEFSGFDEVASNQDSILKSAEKYGLDPDLVKSIIFMETTHGWYDRMIPSKKTIRPMNVHCEFWKEIALSEEKLKDPRFNIDVGCLILSRIRNRIKNPTIRKIASIYNILEVEKVTDYGGRVDMIYRGKLWLKQ